MNGFLFFFGYSKRQISLRATCTTTNAHAEETPRHGAFFHLEIPSVIISGASRASGRDEAEKGEKSDGKVARLSVLHDFYLRIFFLYFLYFLGFNVLRQPGCTECFFFSFQNCVKLGLLDGGLSLVQNDDGFDELEYLSPSK